MKINTEHSKKKLVEELIKVCLESSKAIMEIYATDFDVETKSDFSPVTIADKLSEEIDYLLDYNMDYNLIINQL